MSAPIRTLVLGSCVSRDLFEELPKGEYTLVGYVARQSLISSFSPPVTRLRPPAMASAFQQRMAKGDYESSLPTVLKRTAGQVDLILWDLTDERLGVYLLPDDTVVTRSVDLIAAGAEPELDSEGMLIPFGNDAHFEMWRRALPQLRNVVSKHHPDSRLSLVALPWAERTESGEPTPTSFGLSAREANTLYERYYDTANAAGTEVLWRDRDVRAADDHRWGVAPFHYAASATSPAMLPLAIAEEPSR